MSATSRPANGIGWCVENREYNKSDEKHEENNEASLIRRSHRELFHRINAKIVGFRERSDCAWNHNDRHSYQVKD